MKIALVIGLLAIALVGLGIPSAFALDGPTPPKVGDPVQAGTYPEIQVIALNGATAGDFIMYVDVSCPWTAPIAFDAASTAVATAINATLGGCVGGSASVAGPNGGPWTITISGSSPVDLPKFVLNTGGLTGGSATVNIVQDGTVLAASDTSPHGGFSSLTDFCLQCHQVHTGYPYTDPAGEYALMAEPNVTSTCATCHGYEGASPTGADDPGFSGTEGTASLRAVYTATAVHDASARTEAAWNGWWAGAPSGPSTRSGSAGTFSTYNGGFSCAVCHTPHGEFGQLINSKWVYTSAGTGTPHVAAWANDTAIIWDDPSTAGMDNLTRYLWKAATGWQVCTGTGGGGTCVPAQIRDAEGQLVSLYGYKLLSYVPNHQYPYMNGGAYSTGPGTDLIWGTVDDPTSALPPGGEFANPQFQAGVIALAVAKPSFATVSRLGTLDADITNAATSISVTAPAPTPPATTTALGTTPLPFQIRIGEEILTVTARSGSEPGPFTLTVIRSGENAEKPWLVDAKAAHTAGDDVLLVPSILVDESGFGLKPNGATNPIKIPFHITFSTGTEVAVVVGRTDVTATSGANKFLYTVGRGVDGSSQTDTHAVNDKVYVKSGTIVATVKSWGTDKYNSDQAYWCGTCHTGNIDSTMGGQYHSHPTECVACHGNPADGSSSDFPHSSTSSVLLKEVPDALCLECHRPGTLP